MKHPHTAPGEHQLILGKVTHYGAPIMEALAAHGLPVGRETAFAGLNPDDVKFFLKQQQKCLADSQGSKEEGTYWRAVGNFYERKLLQFGVIF